VSGPTHHPTGVADYLAMERAFYADAVRRSQYDTEDFTRAIAAEHVVGSYVEHERYDYERWLFGGVAIPTGAVALEYGCGPGRMLLRLAPRFARVDGVDISPEVLDIARRRCETLATPPQLFITDGAGPPAGIHDAYDLAYSVICLQHICVHSIRYRILEGLYRALKPGGLLTFQMGFGPGHANMADYELDFVQATGTNGLVDVGVLHPAELAADLERIGFQGLAYALTLTGPGDQHGAWIFVRAIKPGSPSRPEQTEPARWTAHGFQPLAVDEASVQQTRYRQRVHGVVARRRALHQRVAALEQQVAMFESACAPSTEEHVS
jgi:SAM-dependent methyltransferase